MNRTEKPTSGASSGTFKRPLALIITGLCLILASVIFTAVLNIPTSHEETVSFPSSYGDSPVMLKGSYYKADGAEYAVLMCPGYSCDRQKLRPFANIFVSNGMSVMTFDYSGQASSDGKIGFDNAKNDKITKEIADAAVFLHEKSGIAYENIILIGHSMGGRALVRLMYDVNCGESETLIPGDILKDVSAIRNIILMSPEVNYEHSAQASLFAGTKDYESEPWKSYSEDYIRGFNVYLFGSVADDVVSSYDILALFRRFGGDPGIERGSIDAVTGINRNGDRVSVGVTPGILHSYQWYSPEFAAYINFSVEDIINTDRGISPESDASYRSVYNPARILWVYAGYFTALAGIFITLLALNGSCATAAVEPEIQIGSMKKWLLAKLFMWLPGILTAFVICCIAVCMPFGSPVMNIPYMCFIAGYGLVMLFMYRRGKLKGTYGKLGTGATKGGAGHTAAAQPEIPESGGTEGVPAVPDTAPQSPETGTHGLKKRLLRQYLPAAAIAAAAAGLIIYITRASMYRLVPMNIRLFWLVFCGALMTVGYYVSGIEADMLKKHGAGRGAMLLYNLVQYVALFLFVCFYLVIKSYSGVIQQAVNLVIMYLIVIPVGEFVKKKTGNRIFSAAVSAVLFQMFMITSAAIISFF
ncbi:MAG: alpha/beta hydrolase [Clostridia bacterium]|nr:alpha/beta hydrolase [Clostridia bacterium]